MRISSPRCLIAGFRSQQMLIVLLTGLMTGVVNVLRCGGRHFYAFGETDCRTRKVCAVELSLRTLPCISM